MNEWVAKSIQLANGPSYLDRLQDIYPVERSPRRPISPEIVQLIQEAYDRKDSKLLIRKLLDLEKFPIKDPYVAFLRKNDNFIEYNPLTVKRIAEYLYSIGFDEMIRGIEEPIEPNRRMGALFKSWLSTLGFPFHRGEAFVRCSEVCFLQGADADLRMYANNVLGCNLNKNPDFIAKVGHRYIVGEAKFLTGYGGHQDRQLEDALALLSMDAGDAVRVAVLDGVVWIENSNEMHRKVRNLDKPAFTVLLLQEFLEDLFRTT